MRERNGTERIEREIRKENRVEYRDLTECGEGERLREMERDTGTQEWKDGWMDGGKPQKGKGRGKKESGSPTRTCESAAAG